MRISGFPTSVGAFLLISSRLSAFALGELTDVELSLTPGENAIPTQVEKELVPRVVPAPPGKTMDRAVFAHYMACLHHLIITDQLLTFSTGWQC